jgi:hypothetical protein
MCLPFFSSDAAIIAVTQRYATGFQVSPGSNSVIALATLGGLFA